MKKDLQINKPKKKKEFGQHFLHDFKIAERMIKSIETKGKNILEIGCGDGLLTNAILNLSRCKSLTSIEIDEEWASVVKSKINDARFELILEDVLLFDFKKISSKAPFVLLANLPYNISVPIFHLLVANKDLFSGGIFMIQEELAQKICSQKGKSRTSLTLFMQNHFELSLLEKVLPESFKPEPKVVSRTVMFVPKKSMLEPIEEPLFWNFIKKCFHHPRQTLRNNLKQINVSDEDVKAFDPEILQARPQHLELKVFYDLWQKLKNHKILANKL